MTNNYNTLLEDYKISKKRTNVLVNNIMRTRMIYHNILDMIPGGWDVELSPGHIDMIPVDEFVTIDVFDKITKKFTRIFNTNPYVHINKEDIDSSFYLYVGNHDSVIFTIRSKNTEKCDFEIVTETYQTTKPVGYCKLIADKNYLNEVNEHRR